VKEEMFMISLEFLEKVGIFEGLDNKQLAEIKKCCEEEEFQRAAKLFEKGEDAACLWIVREGRVDLRIDLSGLASSEENMISSITDTEAFGWSSLASPYKYRLSGYCAANSCKLIKIERESLRKLFELDPDIGYVVMSNIANVVGRRFHNLQEEVAKRRGQDLLGGW
jgi:CRP-like cAMP-binding protein